MAVTPISIDTQPTSRTVSVGGLAAFNVVASGGGYGGAGGSGVVIVRYQYQ